MTGDFRDQESGLVALGMMTEGELQLIENAAYVPAEHFDIVWGLMQKFGRWTKGLESAGLDDPRLMNRPKEAKI